MVRVGRRQAASPQHTAAVRTVVERSPGPHVQNYWEVLGKRKKRRGGKQGVPQPGANIKVPKPAARRPSTSDKADDRLQPVSQAAPRRQGLRLPQPPLARAMEPSSVPRALVKLRPSVGRSHVGTQKGTTYETNMSSTSWPSSVFCRNWTPLVDEPTTGSQSGGVQKVLLRKMP